MTPITIQLNDKTGFITLRVEIRLKQMISLMQLVLDHEDLKGVSWMVHHNILAIPWLASIQGHQTFWLLLRSGQSIGVAASWPPNAVPDLDDRNNLTRLC